MKKKPIIPLSRPKIVIFVPEHGNLFRRKKEAIRRISRRIHRTETRKNRFEKRKNNWKSSGNSSFYDWKTDKWTVFGGEKPSGILCSAH